MGTCNLCLGKGSYYDPYRRMRVVCENCKDKRVEQVRTGEIRGSGGKFVRLGIPCSIAGSSFDMDLYIAKGSRAMMTPESVSEVSDHLDGLLCGVTAGELPSESILINLGPKSYEFHYISLLFERGYMAGLTLAPYMAGYSILELRLKEERGHIFSDDDIRYQELVDGELCVVYLDAGSTYSSCMAVKGLMQMRALKGLPTIIFSAAWGRDVLGLCREAGDASSYGLATVWSIEYKKEDICDKSSVVEESRVKKPVSGLISNMAFEELLRG